jgi:hydrogenase expression/formation protein HypE
VGELPAERHIGPERARPGDAVLLSGTLGDHGMAIMSVREGLEFEAEIRSDTAPLAGLIERLLDVEPDIHVLRDPTRGGLSATLNEIAKDSGCGIEIDQSQIPIRTPVRSACEILGLDPLQVANEGKFVCLAPAGSTPRLLEAMRGDPRGREAARIGRVVAEHPGIVVSRTELGTARVVPPPSGEQLPRIC